MSPIHPVLKLLLNLLQHANILATPISPHHIHTHWRVPFTHRPKGAADCQRSSCTRSVQMASRKAGGAVSPSRDTGSRRTMSELHRCTDTKYCR